MIGFMVNADELHLQKIWFRDRPLKDTSIFPFFDQNGRVKQLMIIFPSSPDIFMVPWNPSLVKFGFWGTKRLQLDVTELNSYSQFSSASFSNLYHFDPWWILDTNRFWKHWALEPLKQTNCINRFEEKIIGAYFNHDLSGLNKFIIRHGAQDLSHRSANLKELTQRSGLSSWEWHPGKQRTEPPLKPQWQLDPVWDDWARM